MAAESDKKNELVGTMLGPYRVESRLGEGAMGDVFLGVHEELGRPVAIKTLKPHISAQDSLVQRFFAEARAVNLIRHENIVDCTDLVRDPDGQSYMVMEFLEGQTLSDAIEKSGRISPERALAIAKQIAMALSAAHKHDIVHRDLKPDNVFLIRRDGNRDYVKVLDFGIARLRPEQSGMTATKSGVAIGTPAYMSPEQVLGTGVDPRSDIYNLGVVLFEMLTGRVPFQGPSVTEVMMSHVSSDPPELQSLIKVPSRLAGLVARMLAKEADDRPDTMRVVIRELTLLAGDPAPPEEADETGLQAPDPFDETVDSLSEGVANVDEASGSDRFPVEPEAPARGGASRLLFALVAAAAIAALVLFVVYGGNSEEQAPEPPQSAKSTESEQEQAPVKELVAYREQGVPPPPVECRHPAGERQILGLAAKRLAKGSPGSDRGDDREALQMLQSLQAKSSERLMWTGRAVLYVEDAPEDVGALADQAIGLCPSWGATYGLLGAARASAAEFTRARDALKKALDLNAEYHDARFNLGLSQFGLGDYQGAITELKKIPVPMPNKDLLLGRAYSKLEQYQEAKPYLLRAVEVAPNSAGAHFSKGEVLEALNPGSQEASAAFCRAAELGEESARPYCKTP